MNWNDHDKLWNHVFVKVMDVRRMRMEQGDVLRSYGLPASAFFYIVKGRARGSGWTAMSAASKSFMSCTAAKGPVSTSRRTNCSNII